ncbi:pur operon repressor [Mechercharimyces sp. CAU 1602]|uniref:pur operon repressor n=1 Tax=Mechercharimyces sp. CAU 1602 TaxID=2973933 RepID=UPI0021633E69|nr:pur operon repressor [Mechercharimyces sp. CAU 1602]MCS1352373.1 pur operon repressor [Mechercharimyces sp. CAU 1602]
MKWKRSARLVDMTYQLIQRPHSLIPLGEFAQTYQAAKSSISEDLAIIQETFRTEGMGELQTVAGATGGVRFIPRMKREQAEKWIQSMCQRLADPERLLPGGYLYLSDFLGDPTALSQLGWIWATVFADRQADVVVTVETKGIPLAHAVASNLGIPVVVVRKGHRVTEGSVVTINTISGSRKDIRTLSLSRRSLAEGARVIVIDDFMKAGGTFRGLIDLMKEFRAEVVGTGVMVESEVEGRLVSGIASLMKITTIDEQAGDVEVATGTILDDEGGWME